MSQPITRDQLERVAKSGPRWFYWIAGFSLVNSGILLAGGEMNFLIGLGVTLVVDVIGKQIATQTGAAAVSVLAFGVDLIIAGAFALIGFLASGRSRPVYAIGMALYALDAVLLGVLGAWPNVAFHAFVLFSLWVGFSAQGRLAALPPPAPVAWPVVQPGQPFPYPAPMAQPVPPPAPPPERPVGGA